MKGRNRKIWIDKRNTWVYGQKCIIDTCTGCNKDSNNRSVLITTNVYNEYTIIFIYFIVIIIFLHTLQYSVNVIFNKKHEKKKIYVYKKTRCTQSVCIRLNLR